MLEPEPLGEQVEDVAGRVRRIEVLREVVERGHERIEHRLECADEAHPEVAVAVDPREVVAQVATARHRRRSRFAADGALDLDRPEARAGEGHKRRLAGLLVLVLFGHDPRYSR